MAILLTIPNLYLGSTHRVNQVSEGVARTSRPSSAPTKVLSKTKLVGSEAPKDISTLVSSLAQPPPLRKPTDQACANYEGIYHVAMGDLGGAAGTVFFQFVVGQLIYAERNHLKPWVYLNNVSHVVYDPLVHGQVDGIKIQAMVGRNATYVHRPGGHMKDQTPGSPDSSLPLESKQLQFDGTGVWGHYFEPVSDYVPGDTSCTSKPYVTMDMFLITPGIHGFAEWAPRCWRYQYQPDYMTKPHMPLAEWLEPQRRKAHSVINRYIKVRSELRDAAERVNPGCSSKFPCLGLHIRHSDKAAGRRVVETSECLPYVIAFVHSGGQQIYLATDSESVLNEVQTLWPESLRSRLKTIGSDVVRSANDTAVFDMDSHHRTNVEILVEIVALSKCQYLVHGLSAVSESAIWLNFDLHLRSVNLEDPQRLTVASFGALVQMELQGAYENVLPKTKLTDKWWEEYNRDEQQLGERVCRGYDGVLWISSVSSNAGVGRGFFSSVLNQLQFAEKHNLLPWIHLSSSADRLFDAEVHEMGEEIEVHAKLVSVEDASTSLPKAHESVKFVVKEFGGIWSTYMSGNNSIPSSCEGTPMYRLSQTTINTFVETKATWAVRTWPYDKLNTSLWNPSGQLSKWRDSERLKMHKLIEKYGIGFQPFLSARANRVLLSEKCLGVHMRNIAKTGGNREKVDTAVYASFIEAYRRVGGNCVFVATDSRSSLSHIIRTYPEIANMTITQGDEVVRGSKKKSNMAREWSPDYIDKHHRVNSEALVDLILLTRCHFVIHGHSSISEAAFYFNPALSKRSVNVEDDSSSPSDFEQVVSRTLLDESPATWKVPDEVLNATFNNVSLSYMKGSHSTGERGAIVYLAQKFHSSYGRESYSSLKKSMQKLEENYLSRNKNGMTADMFVFHTGDFDVDDLRVLRDILGSHFQGRLYLVNLANSSYWRRPSYNVRDQPQDWYAWPLFSEGYRRMMHWFAIDIWNFFSHFNGQSSQLTYRYIWRLDEDSLVHSPIQYDIFDRMRRNSFVYGFRMCSYEMRVAERMWNRWKRTHEKQGRSFRPNRALDLDMCGFYNNFFVADLDFFVLPAVQEFLSFIDQQGHIYRRRLGDLMIHSMAVYAFATSERIHRFLDFTYEHSTLNKTTGCLEWGGIQAGTDDSEASETLDGFYEAQAINKDCAVNSSFLGIEDLSPSYSRIAGTHSKVSLHTITAGKVELARKGALSG